ncbi:VWA domain-containing protein [Flavobacterium sp. F372]|uniref:VWA domain-containing protein n=1 Tax=Flavobacterium bernardetii TaxID=2813823 RepID=A0ABR7IYM0_9FLAO|nr:VWA domain-containing protein [Flavobacterium bernardetii]MBC5834803.1 VWA domain-containing protein [Flavobacterium bernardetii]NHF70644.1 VWA domain-containing protein [Flavobacterium bernardetii]
MSSSFMHPHFLWLLLVIPIAFYWHYFIKNQQEVAIKMSTIEGLSTKKSLLIKLRPFLYVLKLLALGFIIIALARPRNTQKSSYTDNTSGIDIVIATDVSGSMLATDFKPNRLEAIKEVAYNFIQKRTNDRMGLVVYAGESYTRTPVTSDKAMLLNSLKEVQYNGMVLQDGTAIGIGLATAINRLKDSKTKSKIIILLTDGVNNLGSLDPISAAEIAKTYGIKVYTVGVGTNGMANFPVAKDANGNIVFQPQKVEIDEKLMQEIATITNGKYFRATDNKKLEAIYDEIDRLEKSKITENRFMMFDEQFRPWLLIGLFLLALEMILSRTLFKSFI